MEATIPAKGPAAEANGAARPPRTEIVLREFADIGKYKVRLIQKSTPDKRLLLDIREYANSPTFQGFTRRGVRFMVDEDLPKLLAILEQVPKA